MKRRKRRTDGMELLAALEKDARVTIPQLSAMTGLKRTSVRKKIKEFEKKRIICRYKTVIDWERAGDEKVYAVIEVKIAPERGKGYDALAGRIARFPEVRTMFLVSGTYDLLVVVEGRSMHEVAFFVAEKLAPLERVQSTVSHFMLKRYKEDGEVFLQPESVKRLAVSP